MSQTWLSTVRVLLCLHTPAERGLGLPPISQNAPRTAAQFTRQVLDLMLRSKSIAAVVMDTNANTKLSRYIRQENTSASIMLRRYSSTGGESLHLGPKITTIGSGSCDLCIEGEGVDSQHAVIEYDPMARIYWIKDLGSHFGTEINGRPIFGTHELKEGDQITLGYSASYIFENGTNRNTLHSKNTTPRLPNVHMNPRRVPSPAKLISLDRADRVSSMQNRNRKWAEYRRKINRSGSLDRMRPRRRVIANAWTQDKVAYSVTSPSSSASSWEGQLRTARQENQNQQLIGQLQNRIAQLEKLLKATNANEQQSDNNLTSKKLLQRVMRLQSEIAKKDLELQRLKEQIERNEGENKMEFLERALVKSETEKQELEYLDKAEELLEDREQTIAELVDTNIDLNKEDTATSLESSFPTPWANADADFFAQSMKSTRLLGETNVALDVYRTFLTVLLEDLSDVCLHLSGIANQDELYGVIAEHCIQSAQDKLAQFETKAREILIRMGYRNQAETVDRELRQANTKHWQPITQQLTFIIRIVRDACLGEIHSIKASHSFAQWAAELREQMERCGMTSDCLFDSSTLLAERMNSAGVPDHWISTTLQPVLRMAASIVRTDIEAKFSNRFDASMNTDISLADLDNGEKQLVALREQLAEMNQETNKIQHDLSTYQMENTRLSVTNSDLEEEIGRLKSDVANLEGKCVDLVHESTTLKMTNEQLSIDHMQSQAELGLLKEKVKIMENEIFEGKQSSTTLRAELERLKVEHVELGNRHRLKDSEVAQLREIRKTTEQTASPNRQNDNEQNDQWRDIVSARDDEISKLKQSIHEREKEIFELQEKLIDMDKSKNDLAFSTLQRGFHEDSSIHHVEVGTAAVHEREAKDQIDEHEMFPMFDDSETSFWDLSQRLASLLEVDLKRNEASLGVSSGNSIQQPTAENDDRVLAAEELARGVQELIDRVRQQNEELVTYRSPEQGNSRASTASNHCVSNGKPTPQTTPKTSGRKVKFLCKPGCVCCCHQPKTNACAQSDKLSRMIARKSKAKRAVVKGNTRPKAICSKRKIVHRERRFHKNLWKSHKNQRMAKAERKRRMFESRNR